MSKKFKTQYKTIESIIKRIDELSRLNRDFTLKEELEFSELKKMRNKINPNWHLSV